MQTMQLQLPFKETDMGAYQNKASELSVLQKYEYGDEGVISIRNLATGEYTKTPKGLYTTIPYLLIQ